MNGIPIRLTDERWYHIASQHKEIEGLMPLVMDTIRTPDRVLAGHLEELMAIRQIQNGNWLVVVYRELNDDGFVITAFLTRRIKQLEPRKAVWP